MRRHIAEAERIARARSVVLGSLRAKNRVLLLDELRHYRRRGRFPRNHDVRNRPIPQFIDPHGTRCAVAHLLEISGQGELVRHIAKTENTARVARLARLPELRAWLCAAGLSVDEAARIQPTYCHESEAYACFCGQTELTNLALGTIIGGGERTVQVSVERVQGEFPNLSVGDETTLLASGKLGERIFFSRDPEGGLVSRVGQELVVDGSRVLCQVNERTAQRPVTIDTVFEAFLAEGSCVDVLASDESDWNQSKCTESEDSQAGCGIAPMGNPIVSAVGLTSAAVFVALAAYRRRRRGSNR